MATKKDRIRIEIFDAADERAAGEERVRVSDTAMLQLARLIGRQMAREQVARDRASERRVVRKPSAR